MNSGNTPQQSHESLTEKILGPTDVWWIPNFLERPIEMTTLPYRAVQKTKAFVEKPLETIKGWFSWGEKEEQEAKETYVESSDEKADLLSEVIEGVAMRYLPDTMKWWDIMRPLLNPILGKRQEMFSWENEFRWFSATAGELTPEWALGIGQGPLLKLVEKAAPEMAQAMRDDPEMPIEKIREMLQWYITFKAGTGSPYKPN